MRVAALLSVLGDLGAPRARAPQVAVSPRGFGQDQPREGAQVRGRRRIALRSLDHLARDRGLAQRDQGVPAVDLRRHPVRVGAEAAEHAAGGHGVRQRRAVTPALGQRGAQVQIGGGSGVRLAGGREQVRRVRVAVAGQRELPALLRDHAAQRQRPAQRHRLRVGDRGALGGGEMALRLVELSSVERAQPEHLRQLGPRLGLRAPGGRCRVRVSARQLLCVLEPSAALPDSRQRRRGAARDGRGRIASEHRGQLALGVVELAASSVGLGSQEPGRWLAAHARRSQRKVVVAAGQRELHAQEPQRPSDWRVRRVGVVDPSSLEAYRAAGGYVALSRDLAGYLQDAVGIAPGRIEQIYNGVDAERFAPAPKGAVPIAGAPFAAPDHWLIGTVGRMQTVKHQTLLARAFVRALELAPELRATARLVMVGEGPLRAQCQSLLDEAGAAALAWLPGERADVPDVMRGLNCFVLPSLAEGISNTILEAMATALPVIATRVGGNAELVDDGRTGALVPPDDVDALAQALVHMATDPARAAALGRAGRAEVERRFSLQAMVSAYQALYDRELGVRS